MLLLSAWLLAPPPVPAQRQPGAMGVGFQVGRPGGAVVKVYQSGVIAYDGVLTTDADEFVASRVHRLWESPIPDSPLHFYLGPGGLLGAEQLDRSPQLRLGLSTEAGLNFYAERFEVFLHVTPTFRFFPDTETYLDGNVGLRYYVRFR